MNEVPNKECYWAYRMKSRNITHFDNQCNLRPKEYLAQKVISSSWCTCISKELLDTQRNSFISRVIQNLDFKSMVMKL